MKSIVPGVSKYLLHSDSRNSFACRDVRIFRFIRRLTRSSIRVSCARLSLRFIQRYYVTFTFSFVVCTVAQSLLVIIKFASCHSERIKCKCAILSPLVL